MNNVLTTPIGLDAEIQKIQISLYSFLTSRWNGTIQGYGKAYKSQKQKSVVLEWWNTADNDYQDVYFDDNFSATFFFIENDSDPTEDEMVFTSNVKCVLMVNLPSIISDVGRQDAQAHRDVVELLRSKNLVVDGIEKGIETVFGGIDTDKIKFNNEQPHHCFAVTMQLNYYLTDKCN